jgi:RHS repeat-associated protein
MTVNGCQASTSYGQSSTAAGLASTLANGVNAGDCGVNATANGSGIALTATSTGSNTDYSLSSGSSTNLPAQFSSPAFTVAGSGPDLSGGTNEQITLTTTTYTYDALNRPLSVTHSNPSNATAAWAYDGTSIPACPGISVPTLTSPTNLIGRRSSMCSQQSASSFGYDPLGRIIAEIRSIGLNTPITNATAYTYHKDGSLSTVTYPSDDIVTYTVGGAGRVTEVSDGTNKFVGTPSSPAVYAPHGALVSMIQGSGITTQNVYNDRLQPVLLSAGPSAGPVFSLCYDFHLGIAINNSPCNFGASTTGNNGNVFQVLNNIDSTRSATYAYDSLNRIMQANTINTTSENCWSEVYTIDAWANLYNRAGASGMGNCYTEGLSAGATVQNQLSGIGIVYDAAGNVINDGLGNTPTYDAENRMATFAGVTYSYDADSTRIEKSSGTMYWTGPGGEYLTETDLTGNIKEEYIFFNGARIGRVDRPSGAVHYYFSDDLSSASLITDASGNVDESYYYYPYGGQQSTAGSGDPNHYKFTGKERDAESGLDMFGARYYGSSMGRFMTPDWAAKPTAVPYAHYGNPQSLNLYSYVQNNPTTVGDPDGHCSSPKVGNGQVGVCIDLYIQAKTINVVGQGDSRGPAANDPKATYRVEMQLVADPKKGTVSLVKDDAGVSKALGGLISNKGTSTTSPISPTTDDNGTTHFTVNNTAMNGLHDLPGAPKDSIKTTINMDITSEGKVGIEGGMRTAYPSLEIYSYSPGGQSTSILQMQEHSPSDLANQNQSIPQVAPQ